jgi:hypothetical protein
MITDAIQDAGSWAAARLMLVKDVAVAALFVGKCHHKSGCREGCPTIRRVRIYVEEVYQQTGDY